MKTKVEEAQNTSVGIVVEELKVSRKIRSLDEIGVPMTAPISESKTNRSLSEIEAELKEVVATGDVELLYSSEGFQRRSVEGKVLLTADTLGNLHTKLEKALKILVNGGQEDREAAMGIVTRMRAVRDKRAEILRDLYRQHPKVLTSEGLDGEVGFGK